MMVAESQPGTAHLMGGAGRHWEWVLAFGIVNVAIGVLALAWPGRTVVVLAVLFGIELIVAGVYRFVAALASDDESGGTRVLLAVLGVLSFIVGLYAVRHVAVTVTLLALILGIFWVVNGAMELFTALAYRGTPSRGWTIAMGVLSMVAGVVVLAYPGMSLATLAVFLGLWLLILGGMAIVVAFQMRSVGRAANRLAAAM
jgi:uncharacterized membrane protein HdeD (DUF308 family)